MTPALEEPPAATRPSRGLLSTRIQQLGTENAFKIGPHIKRVEDEGHRVIRCNLGEPDFPLAPHIREEVKRQLDLDLTHYCDPQGLLPLREAIAHARHLARSRRRLPRRQAADRFLPGGLLRRGR
jgi:DNA-binding transcriptional MocR family regulator